MNGLADILTKLYKRFFLRDLLSYVCPGLIVITSIYYFTQESGEFINNIKDLDIGFGGVVLIFLFSFVIGLGINGFSEYIIGDITFEYPKPSKERINFLIRKIQMLCISKMKTKAEAKGDLSFINEQRDRYVIIKQMSRNNAVAIFICALIFSFYPHIVSCNILYIASIYISHVKIMIYLLHFNYISIALILLASGLLINAQKTYNNQSDFEYVVKYNFKYISSEARRIIE